MYEAKTFDIPDLIGITETNINEHLGLYKGYVKNTNMILQTIQDGSVNGYALSEMQRRFSFEFNGMKNHEHYFGALEGGAKKENDQSELHIAITTQFGSFENFISRFKTIAKTRGIGWSVLYYDKENQMLLHGWIDEQHLGLLNSCNFVFGIDMWEHAFVSDYLPSGKGKYIEDYLKNVNWSIVEKKFKAILS